MVNARNCLLLLLYLPFQIPSSSSFESAGSAGAVDEEDTASQQSEDTPARRSEREQIKRDLLMGHLLSLATQNSPSALPSHALPALAASLSGKGLMPKWVHWSLTHQPALFNRAFESLFSQVRGVLPNHDCNLLCIAATCTGALATACILAVTWHCRAA